MAITRIKNNQITDSTIVASNKVQANSVTAGLLENNLTYNSNLTVTGNLTVNGTTTTISTTNTTVEDPILVLASQQTGAGALDIGFIGERGTDQNVFFGWDESADSFVAGFVAEADSNTVVTVGSNANLTVGALTTTSGTSNFNALTVGPGATNVAVLNATGLASLDGGIDVDGAFTVADGTGNISTSGTLGVTGTSTLGIINATGLASLDGGIDVDGAFTVADTTGNVSTTGTLGAGSTTINGTLTATSLASLDGGIDMDGQFIVADTTGNITSAGTLTQNGTSDFNALVTMGDLTFDALATIDAGGNKITNMADPTSAQDGATKAYVDSVASSGFTLSAAAASSTISGGDTLTLNGTANEIELTHVAASDTVTIGLPDNVTIGSTLTVTSTATVNGLLNANAGIAVDTTAFTVANTTGNVATAGTLDVAGLASLDGGIDVDGAFTIANTTGNLVTSGTSDFNGLVTMGSLTVDATSTLDFGANALTNVADPSGAQDAATKNYVDGLISTGFTLSAAAASSTISGGDTLTLNGTANEIELTHVAASDTVTIGLPNDVTIGNDLTVTGDATVGLTFGVTGATTLAKTTVSQIIVSEVIVSAGSFVPGSSYEIVTVGTTDYTLIGASSNTVGVIFTATGAGSGDGTAKLANTIDAGGNRVANVSDPTQAQDAATKAYVDSIATTGFTLAGDTGSTTISGSDTMTVAGTTNEVETAVSGDTITIGLPNDVTIGNDLTVTNNLGVTGTSNVGIINATGLASLDGGIDVDGAFTVADTTGDISTTGGLNVDGATTLAGTTWDAASTIDAGANKITNMADPTAAQDATTKAYVDALVSSGTVWKDPVKDPDIQDVVTAEPTLSGNVGDTLTYIYYGAGETFDTGGTTVVMAQGDVATATITSTGPIVADWVRIESAPLTAGDRYIIAAEHGTIGATLYAAGFRNNDLIQYVSGDPSLFASWTTPHDAGYQVIQFNAPKAAGDSTGLVATTSYTLDVSFNGTPSTLSVASTGTEVDTFGELAAALSTQANAAYAGASVVLEPEGHFHIYSGDGTKVIISEGTGGTPLLAALGANFVDLYAGLVDGLTVIVNDPDSAHYSHTYLYSHDANSWAEISGPGAIEAGNQLSYSGNILNVVDGPASGLDADLLDSQQGSYYLDWTNTTNKPDPTITLGGDATGSITLTDLTGGTLTVTVVDDSHNHIIANVDGLQAALDAKLNDTGDTMDGAYTVTPAGSISWATAPSVASHLTNKAYVDGLISAGFTLSAAAASSTISGGDTLTINGTANEVDITHVAASDTVTIGLPSDVTIGNNLTVTNALSAVNTNITGTLDVALLASLDGGIDVDGAFTVANTTGNISTTGTLGVTGVTTLTGLLNANGGIAVDTSNFTVNGTTGAVATASTLDVAGLASLDGGIDMDGVFTVADTTGNTSIGGTLTVTSTTDLNGLLTVGSITVDATSTLDAGANKWTNLADPTVAQDAATKAYVDSVASTGFTAAGDIGSTTISGGDTFTIAGTANEIETAVAGDTVTIGLPNDVTITNALNVNGLASLDGGIDVDGAFTVANTSGNINTTGTLGVTGTATVTGLATLNGGIAVDGVNFTVSGTTGAVSTASTITAAGIANLNGGIAVDSTAFTVADVTGNTAIAGTLDVNGQADLVNTNVVGILDVNGQIDVDNITLDGNGIQATAGTGISINPSQADYNFRVATTGDANTLFVDGDNNSVHIGAADAASITGVQFYVAGNTSTILSRGTTGERPTVGVAGMMRFNTTTNEYEYYDGTLWAGFGTEFTVIASETFAGTGAQTVYTLASAQTTASCIVSINGVVQLPTTAYAVSGTTLTFTEAPAVDDVIEVRELTTTTTVNGFDNGVVSVIAGTGSEIDVTGHLVPTTDITYDLGSATNKWRDLYLDGATIYMGNGASQVRITNDAGTVKFFQNDGVTPAAVDLGTTLDPDITIDGGTY